MVLDLREIAHRAMKIERDRNLDRLKLRCHPSVYSEILKASTSPMFGMRPLHVYGLEVIVDHWLASINAWRITDHGDTLLWDSRMVDE